MRISGLEQTHCRAGGHSAGEYPERSEHASPGQYSGFDVRVSVCIYNIKIGGNDDAR